MAEVNNYRYRINIIAYAKIDLILIDLNQLLDFNLG
jgi:hypothetical protein